MNRDDRDMEDLVFYYSRERRLARAPQRVRELYNSPGRKRGALRTLIPGRSSILLFITIAIVMVFLFTANRSAGRTGEAALAGNRLTISGRAYSGNTYITLRKAAVGDTRYTGPVSIAVSIPRKGGRDPESPDFPPIANHQVFFSLAQEEEFGFSVPFHASQLLVLLKAGDALLSRQITIK